MGWSLSGDKPRPFGHVYELEFSVYRFKWFACDNEVTNWNKKKHLEDNREGGREGVTLNERVVAFEML